MTNDEIWDTAQTLAEFLRLSDKSVYRLWRKDRTFPAAKIGGAVRFPRSRVVKWLNDRTQGRAMKSTTR